MGGEIDQMSVENGTPDDSVAAAEESRKRLEELGNIALETLDDGIGWQRAENGDEVVIRVVSRASDGTVLRTREEFGFTLGDASVPKEWNDAVRAMAKGEVVRLTAPEPSLHALYPEGAAEHEIRLLRWVTKTDVFGDGSAIEWLYTDGTGWERPGKLCEVCIRVAAFRPDKEETILFSAPEFTLAVSGAMVPDVLRRSITGMKRGSVVRLRCAPERTVEMDQLFGAQLKGELVFEIEMRSWFKIEDIDGDGSVVKKSVTDGLGWEKPGEGGVVTVELVYRKTGSDSSVFSETKKTIVGDGLLVDGLDRALLSMKRGEKARISLKKEKAFEPCPWLSPEGIEPHDDVDVDVHLLDFTRAPSAWTLPFEEGLSLLMERKERGNTLFKEGRLGLALRHYQRACEGVTRLQTSDLTANQKTQLASLQARCLVNSAACYDKLGKVVEMFKVADDAVDIEPNNVKALYRRGCASILQNKFYEAQRDLRYASELSHEKNVEVKRKLREVNSKISEEEEMDRRKYSKGFKEMFGKMGSDGALR